jgi:bis(5'-nucleosyl)-tetraphosphatase (symmetrical)
MSTYAIGDLQGCFLTLQRLLEHIGFDRRQDRLWFVGDLVNRGAGSLACLRFVRDLGDRAVAVLGNHDLHLLAVAEGVAKLGKHDTLQEILDSPERDSLLEWLRRQTLLHVDDKFAMVHAGLLPGWDWETARRLSGEISRQLRGDQCVELLENMYGNDPAEWQDSLAGHARSRVILNAMTRMRIVDSRGRMDLKFKGELSAVPEKFTPWFNAPTNRPPTRTVVFGHWSALGLYESRDFIGLDSGCVWGRELTALRLDDRKLFQVPCAESFRPAGWD